MKLPATTKSVLLNSICLLYILLFVYAAVSKLLDFENFQLQLAQSPLITAYAGFISRAVLFIEIVIALLLAVPRLRLVGLFAAFSLMVLFTIYIFIILNYSSFVPCSCGGVLEKLGWTAHLVFNIFFIVLAVIAILLLIDLEKVGVYFVPIRLLLFATMSIILMSILFLTSEDIVHRRNNFVRQFPPFPVKKAYVTDLKYNSYYFAGKGEGKIYLGNITAPSLVTVMDTSLKSKKVYRIHLEDSLVKFRSVQIRIFPPYFYVFDGTVPCIFKGSIKDWKATLKIQDSKRFSVIEVIDSNTVAFRALSNLNENILGTINFKDNPVIKYHPELLQKQIDGVFDTDGTLQFSKELKRFVYLYYYRNQFIVTDSSLNLLYRGNTIDTTSKAKLKITYLEKRKEKKFAAPPYMVNRLSTVHNNLLFVNSSLPGRYDPMVMWKDANIVDVYDIRKNSYLMSFYIYKINGEQMDSFMVTDTHLFVLFANRIVSYRLTGSLKKDLSKDKISRK